jgi:hypothetical protein
MSKKKAYPSSKLGNKLVVFDVFDSGFDLALIRRSVRA